MTQKETYLTSEGLKKLQEELNNLRNVRRKEVATRIQDAKEVGGTVDNADYDEAKNEQAFIEGRILTLENMIDSATVIPDRQRPSGKISIGAKVSVVGDSGKKEQYVLVGSTEASPLEGRISNESPVGRALLGHKVGDKVEVKTPAGVIKLKIVDVK